MSMIKLKAVKGKEANDQVATYIHEYPFKTAPQRDSEAFGVEQFGRLVLIEKNKLGVAVQAMEDAAR
jgi:protein BCP1